MGQGIPFRKGGVVGDANSQNVPGNTFKEVVGNIEKHAAARDGLQETKSFKIYCTNPH